MRASRQSALINLIQNKKVGSQVEARKLLEEAGFATTQATVSRDLEEISAVRIRDADGHRYIISQPQSEFGVSIATVMRSYLISITSGGNLVVIKTPPGHAAVVAAAIDRTQIEGVLGTVAGDDTLFVCAASDRKAQELVKLFQTSSHKGE